MSVTGWQQQHQQREHDQAPPRLFISYAHDTQAHKDDVRAFSTFLRTQVGLDVMLDQWHQGRRRDWAEWAMTHMTNADFIIAIASADYKVRGDGQAPSDVGRGSQFEAAKLRDFLTRDRRVWTERILPVVLPGWTEAHLPEFLNAYSTDHYKITAYTEAAISDLRCAITGVPEYEEPPLGVWQPGRQTQRQVVEQRWVNQSSEVEAGGASLGGRLYHRSLLLRSMPGGGSGFAELELSGGAQRFTAVAGVLDDAVEGYQKSRFRIFVDGVLQWEERPEQGTPVTVDVPVRGAVLRLEMERPAALPDGTGRRVPELAWGDPVVR